jgi:hypothetical protein
MGSRIPTGWSPLTRRNARSWASRTAQRTDKSKALVLWSRTLELLERGGGGSAPFVKAGFKAEAVNFIARDKVIGRVTVRNVQSPYPYGRVEFLPDACGRRSIGQALIGAAASLLSGR